MLKSIYWSIRLHIPRTAKIGGNRDSVTAPVIIEDHVWIGKTVTVLKGVKIGEGVIIGAGSIVVRDIPPRCMAVGTPARVIKKDVKWE